jgi:beta-glucosidase/6-phospho-beta-glucosidase/beta-galactosidase
MLLMTYLNLNLFMKRVFILGLVATVLVFSACKGGKKEESGDVSTATQSSSGASAEEHKQAANQPREYKVTFTPDSAVLGKKKEALVHITSATAIALTDPDGKDKGIELTINLTVTNKSHIGEGSSISVSYAESRLQLDNGTNITHDSGTDYLRAQPEATSKEESWTYKIPTGAKPSALNLFMDDTRVSVGVALSEK